jgi:hypothetical protein
MGFDNPAVNYDLTSEYLNKLPQSYDPGKIIAALESYRDTTINHQLLINQLIIFINMLGPLTNSSKERLSFFLNYAQEQAYLHSTLKEIIQRIQQLASQAVSEWPNKAAINYHTADNYFELIAKYIADKESQGLQLEASGNLIKNNKNPLNKLINPTSKTIDEKKAHLNVLLILLLAYCNRPISLNKQASAVDYYTTVTDIIKTLLRTSFLSFPNIQEKSKTYQKYITNLAIAASFEPDKFKKIILSHFATLPANDLNATQKVAISLIETIKASITNCEIALWLHLRNLIKNSSREINVSNNNNSHTFLAQVFQHIKDDALFKNTLSYLLMQLLSYIDKKFAETNSKSADEKIKQLIELMDTFQKFSDKKLLLQHLNVLIDSALDENSKEYLGNLYMIRMYCDADTLSNIDIQAEFNDFSIQLKDKKHISYIASYLISNFAVKDQPNNQQEIDNILYLALLETLRYFHRTSARNNGIISVDSSKRMDDFSSLFSVSTYTTFGDNIQENINKWSKKTLFGKEKVNNYKNCLLEIQKAIDKCQNLKTKHATVEKFVNLLENTRDGNSISQKLHSKIKAPHIEYKQYLFTEMSKQINNTKDLHAHLFEALRRCMNYFNKKMYELSNFPTTDFKKRIQDFAEVIHDLKQNPNGYKTILSKHVNAFNTPSNYADKLAGLYGSITYGNNESKAEQLLNELCNNAEPMQSQEQGKKIRQTITRFEELIRACTLANTANAKLIKNLDKFEQQAQIVTEEMSGIQVTTHSLDKLLQQN